MTLCMYKSVQFNNQYRYAVRENVWSKPKNVKSHVFFDFQKNIKNIKNETVITCILGLVLGLNTTQSPSIRFVVYATTKAIYILHTYIVLEIVKIPCNKKSAKS